MTTIRQEIFDYLFSNGLFETQADAIIDYGLRSGKLQDIDADIEKRMNESVEAYPAVFANALKIHFKNFAIDWLDANMPMHLALFMLDPDRMAEE